MNFNQWVTEGWRKWEINFFFIFTEIDCPKSQGMGFFNLFFSFFFFFFFFFNFPSVLPACRISFLWWGTESGPPQWNSWVLTTGPPGNSFRHWFLSRVSEGNPHCQLLFACLCILWSSGQLSNALLCIQMASSFSFLFSFTLAILDFTFQQNISTWSFP